MIWFWNAIKSVNNNNSSNFDYNQNDCNQFVLPKTCNSKKYVCCYSSDEILWWKILNANWPLLCILTITIDLHGTDPFYGKEEILPFLPLPSYSPPIFHHLSIILFEIIKNGYDHSFSHARRGNDFLFQWFEKMLRVVP